MDLNGITSVFRSPEASVIANQAVMAADMAARQGLAAVQLDAERLLDTIRDTEESHDSAEVSERGRQAASGTGATKGRNKPGGALAPMAPGAAGDHHIDFLI